MGAKREKREMVMMRRRSATIIDVARRAGVSKTTAASILRNAVNFQASPATRSRVLDSARELNYQRNELAAALAYGRAKAVGILLPLDQASADAGMSNTYGKDIFLAAFKAASVSGLHVIPVPLVPGADLTLKDLTDRRMDGVILASPRTEEFVRSVYDSAIPCAEIGSGFGENLVHPDNEGGIALAIAHLVGLGHRRIGYWELSPVRGYAATHRRDGFLQAAGNDHGIVFAGSACSGHDELLEILKQPADTRPTGMIAFSDTEAVGICDAARALGLRVPEDLSVVGFDDNILAQASRPQLTTIHNPLDAQANAAIALLMALWRGEPTEHLPRVIPTHLVVRQSTAPAPEPGGACPA